MCSIIRPTCDKEEDLSDAERSDRSLCKVFVVERYVSRFQSPPHEIAGLRIFVTRPYPVERRTVPKTFPLGTNTMLLMATAKKVVARNAAN